MKISIIGRHEFLKPFTDYLEREGHFILFNQFSKDIEVILVQNHWHYKINKYLKELKKNNIKIINLILDIPIYRLQEDFRDNSIIKYFQEFCHNFSYKNLYMNKIVQYFSSNINKNKIFELSGIDDNGDFIRNINRNVLDLCDYGCGLFWFKKR